MLYFMLNYFKTSYILKSYCFAILFYAVFLDMYWGQLSIATIAVFIYFGFGVLVMPFAKNPIDRFFAQEGFARIDRAFTIIGIFSAFVALLLFTGLFLVFLFKYCLAFVAYPLTTAIQYMEIKEEYAYYSD